MTGAGGLPGGLSGLLFALLVPSLFVMVVVATAGEARVGVDGGLVSGRFEAVPAGQAFDAIREATGIEVSTPPSVREVPITLTVEPRGPEQFLRRVLDALGVTGFVVVYEADGRLRAVVVAAGGRPAETGAREGEGRARSEPVAPSIGTVASPGEPLPGSPERLEWAGKTPTAAEEALARQRASQEEEGIRRGLEISEATAAALQGLPASGSAAR